MTNPEERMDPWKESLKCYEDFADEGITLPTNNMGDTTFVQLGLIDQTNATSVTYNNYVYYFGSSSPPPPGEELDWVLSIAAIIMLIIINC